MHTLITLIVLSFQAIANGPCELHLVARNSDVHSPPSPLQRRQLMVRELYKLGLPSPTPYDLTGAHFAAWSAQNLQIIKDAISHRYTPLNPVTESLLQLIDASMADLEFHFVMPVNKDTPPVLNSDYILKKRRTSRPEKFYSKLVDTAGSVEFKIIVAHRLSNDLQTAGFKLNRSLAMESGFVTPALDSLLELLNIGTFLDAKFSEKMRVRLKLFLGEGSLADNLLHVPISAFKRKDGNNGQVVQILREELRHWLLTPEDAITAIRLLVRSSLIQQAGIDAAGIKSFLEGWHNAPARAQRYVEDVAFGRSLLSRGFSLHLPVSMRIGDTQVISTSKEKLPVRHARQRLADDLPDPNMH